MLKTKDLQRKLARNCRRSVRPHTGLVALHELRNEVAQWIAEWKKLKSLIERMGGAQNRLSWLQGENREVRQQLRWANDIAYIDSEQRGHTLSVLECKDIRPDGDGEEKATKFKWV